MNIYFLVNLTTYQRTYTSCSSINTVTDSDKTAWYKGRDVCSVVGYTNPRLALPRNVDKSYKKQLKELIHDASYHDGKTVYSKSRQANVNEWIRWLDGKADECEELCIKSSTEKPQHVWKYKGKGIKIRVGSNGKEWLRGRDVCLILGFQDIHKTLQRQVKKAYKCDLKSLIPWVNSSPVCNTHKEDRAVYISEPGLYQLIFSKGWKLPMSFTRGFLKRFCQPFAEPANSKPL